MNDSNYDKELISILFKQNCIDDEISNTKELVEIFNNLVSTKGWEIFVSELSCYLKECISNRREAFNFATWLFMYNFGKCNIKDPYPFLVCLYKKMELDKNINDDF